CGEHRHIRHQPPEPSGPDRIIRIALFEFDPDLRAYRWNDEASRLDSCCRHTGHRPARWDFAEHVRNLHHDAADLLGIDVLDHQTRVFSVFFCWIPACSGLLRTHDGTVGTVDTKPFRLSLKLCLYSPRLILWVTLFT